MSAQTRSKLVRSQLRTGSNNCDLQAKHLPCPTGLGAAWPSQSEKSGKWRLGTCFDVAVQYKPRTARLGARPARTPRHLRRAWARYTGSPARPPFNGERFEGTSAANPKGTRGGQDCRRSERPKVTREGALAEKALRYITLS